MRHFPFILIYERNQEPGAPFIFRPGLAKACSQGNFLTLGAADEGYDREDQHEQLDPGWIEQKQTQHSHPPAKIHRMTYQRIGSALDEVVIIEQFHILAGC